MPNTHLISIKIIMITIACFGTVLQCFRNISGISEFYIEILSLSVAMNAKKKEKKKIKIIISRITGVIKD